VIERSVLDKALKRALELGADEAEVYASVTHKREVKSEGRKLKAVSLSTVSASVRVAVDKRVAIARATSLDEEVLLGAVEEAVSAARVSEKDEHWPGLPGPAEPLHGWIGYDEGIATLEPGYLVELAKYMIGEVDSLGRDLMVASVEASAHSGETLVMNTRGVDVSERGTGMVIMLELKKGEGTGFSFDVSRSLLGDIQVYGVIDEAARLTLDAARAEKLGETFKGPVLFDPVTVAPLLNMILSQAFNGELVVEGYSPLAGKLGQHVLGSLTLYDDGTIPGALGTSLYDAEGVPRRRTLLAEEGVVKGFLHNTYTAARMGTESTGNASRGGRVGVSHSNLVVKPGRDSWETLEEAARIVARGFLLSVHTVNYVTGNFSVVASNPYLVRGGEEKPVKPVTLAGNFYELSPGIVPGRRVRHTYMAVATPPLLVDGVTVSG